MDLPRRSSHSPSSTATRTSRSPTTSGASPRPPSRSLGSYRSRVLFTSPEGALSRDGIKSALDQREEELKKEAQRVQEQRVREQDINAAMNNPQMIAARLQNPQIQAMLQQLTQGGGHAHG